MRLQISASIVLYKNEPEQVQTAARSFLSCPLRSHMLFVDNSPTDKLRAIVNNTGADYLFNGQNLGFAAAHNLAIRRYLSRSEYHLILNPDVRFEPETLVPLYNFMQANSEVGVVMPRVLYPDGGEQHLCKLLPRPLDLIARRFGGRLSRRLLKSSTDRYLLRDVKLEAPAVVPCLSGCFLLIRTEVLKKVGAFDERYFMYMEDVDLCRRIGVVSPTVFYPGVAIFHDYAKGSYSSGPLLRYHLKSAWRYFCKWGWFKDDLRDRLNERAWNQAESVFLGYPALVAKSSSGDSRGEVESYNK